MHTQLSIAGHHDASHGIDLAPMLDFVVNLLIFFIITAVFVKESAVTVRRPTSDSGSEKPTTSISVLANGDILIGGKPVDVRAVRANVEQIRAVDEHAGIVVVANVRAPTGTLISVVDQAHLGGIYDITFTTSE